MNHLSAFLRAGCRLRVLAIVLFLLLSVGCGSTIHRAVERDDSMWLREILAKDVEVDELREGKTPLMRAAALGHTDMVDLLLLAGADANAQATDDGSTALHEAAGVGQIQSAETLLRAGAAIDATDNSGRTALHRSASSGERDTVLCLLRAKAAREVPDSNGVTPLHAAVRSGSEETVKLLLRARCSVQTKNSDGETPLMSAVDSGNPRILARLLMKGAEPDEATEKGRTALHRAARANEIKMVQMLLKKGASIDQTDGDGWAALHHAIAGEGRESALLLMKRGARAGTWNRASPDPLQLAAATGDVKIGKALLSDRSSSSLNSAKADGWTPLMTAVSNEHHEFASLLVEAGARSPNANTTHGESTQLAAIEAREFVGQAHALGGNHDLARGEFEQAIEQYEALRAVCDKEADRLSGLLWKLRMKSFGQQLAVALAQSAVQVGQSYQAQQQSRQIAQISALKHANKTGTGVAGYHSYMNAYNSAPKTYATSTPMMPATLPRNLSDEASKAELSSGKAYFSKIVKSCRSGMDRCEEAIECYDEGATADELAECLQEVFEE